MFRKLLTLDEAEKVIYQHFTPKSLGVEKVSLLEGHNRVLGENVAAALDIPPFNRSTVDGYAVIAADTFGADENRPLSLKVCGRINAGEKPNTAVACGSAAEIVTGAPMPEGADAVIMIENTKQENGDLYIYSAVAKDENIMKAGADIRKGETILRAGSLLGSREIGVLAAIGTAKVKVCLIPRVAVLSTGAEVTEPGGKLAAGRIYDINAYSLSAAVSESGAKPVYLGVFPDDESELRRVLRQALVSADAVVTSGGVSVGAKDVVPRTVDSLGKPGVIVSGIAVKPGKPTTVAVVDGKLVFSLPGHPTSALLIFNLLVSPIIRLMSGRKAREAADVKAFAAMRMFPAKGRRSFITIKLMRDKTDRLVAEPIPIGLSGAITTLAKADGYVEIAENVQFVDAGEEVRVRLFKNLQEDLF